MPDQEPQAKGGASELASFGEELRREREIRGISLKEISDATKVSRRFLEAIERNDHRTLPAPAFTRGFVREYARYLGLNADEMVNRYNSAAATDDRVEKPPAIARYPQTLPRDIRPRPPRKRGIPPVWSRIDRSAVALVFTAAALAAVAWWAVKNRAFDPAGREEPQNVPTVTAKVVAPSGVRPQAAAVPQDDSRLHLTVETTAASWITLEADGATVFNEELPAGGKRVFEAADEFRFRTIGNAGGVSVVLNGTLVPSLGGEGEVVRNRVFDRAELTRLRSPAGAAAAQSEPPEPEPPESEPAEPEPVRSEATVTTT